ncbi:MAG: triose-phosphate isomerase [Nitrospirota bacterium]|nr:triose-phosphate isomerase [Nitrospirota bacterium]
MHPDRTPVMAGNWKLHKGIHDTGGYVRELVQALKERGDLGCEVIIAPVFTSLAVALQAVWGSPIKVAAQNCHWEETGAFTGEISAAMLKEVGVSHVILGHSERRQYFGETDATVNGRLKATLAQRMAPIFCIGETIDQRRAGETERVLERQLNDGLAGLGAEALSTLIVAYEPVWAIGTGEVATPEQAQAAHAYIRGWFSKAHGDGFANRVRLLYGGSAKPDNVKEILACPDVDGCLIGGASLTAESFLPMIDAAASR